jgi:predicted small lipoprotein YifL
VLHSFAPAAMLLAVALAACGGQGPGLTDPKEIITQGLRATGEAKSLHIDVAVSGSVNIPETGGTFNLEGTTAGGDFDIANDRLRLTFAVPAFLGLTGEAIQIGSDSYVKTSLSGPKYVKSSVEDSGVPVDPAKAFTEVESFLAKDGVVSEKLDDVDCGDRTCYAVRLTIPSSLLAGAGTSTGVDPSVIGESLVVNLQFDRENLRIRQASTDISAGEMGTLGVILTFSKYDEAVEVNAPPSDQVTTEGGALPF